MILPSIIANSQKEFDKRFEKVKSFSKFHLDVMDGKFVKNKSLMFNFKLPKNKKFEAHLMVKNPKTWIKKHGRKVDNIIVHYESMKGVSLSKKISLAINPKTSVNEIRPFLSKINKVLVMTVTPGKYGSKFLSSTLKKIKELKSKTIEVDGGINPTTIKKAKKAGATQFVVGSYLQKSKDMKKSISKLKQ
tara:strand:- start:37 stop:606 length:570 start_codon:yes stop_codon:yes gene_type:complete